MPTKQSTADYILDQLSPIGDVSVRRMFGNYCLYHDGKVVGLICNDTLFIKITEQGKKFVGKYYQEGRAYPGAKASIMVDDDRIEEREWLCELVSITALNLPLPKSKKLKTTKFC